MSIWGDILNAVGGAINTGVHDVEGFFGGGGGGHPSQPAAPQQSAPATQQINQATGFYPSIQDQIASTQQQAQQQQAQQQQQQQQNNSKKKPKESIAQSLLDEAKNLPGVSTAVQDIRAVNGASQAADNAVSSVAKSVGGAEQQAGQALQNFQQSHTDMTDTSIPNLIGDTGIVGGVGNMLKSAGVITQDPTKIPQQVATSPSLQGIVNNKVPYTVPSGPNAGKTVMIANPSAVMNLVGGLTGEGLDARAGVADIAYHQTVKNGGVTINLDGNQPSEGYAYSPYKDSETVVPKTDFTPQHVTNFMNQNADRLAQPGNHLGLWEDDGKIYMDVSQIGPPTPETIQAAEQNGQLAVFDLKNFNEIPTKLKGAANGEEANLNPVSQGENAGAGSPGGNASPGEVPLGQEPGQPQGQVNPNIHTTPEEVKAFADDLQARAQALREPERMSMAELEDQLQKTKQLISRGELPPDRAEATQQEIDRRNVIKNDPNQQTQNKVAITAKTDKGVIGQVATTTAERLSRFNKAIATADGKTLGREGLNSRQMALLDDALRGKDVGDPAVMRVASQLHDAYDYSLATDRAGGSLTMRLNKGKYAPLYFKAAPEQMDALGVRPQDRVQSGPYTGFRDQGRYYRSYDEGIQKGGLERLNPNAIEDARMYAQQGHAPIRNNLLYQHLNRVAPGEISADRNETRIGDTPLSAAANGELPFNVSDRLNKRLEGFKSSRFSNPIAEAAMKVVEAPLKLFRKVAFLGAPIHYANLTEKELNLTLPSGHVITGGKTLATSLAGVTHPAVYDAMEAAAEKSGVRDFYRQLGIPEAETRPNLLGKGTGFRGTVDKKSLFATQYRNLARFNNVVGWRLAERVMQLGVDPSTAEGQAIGTELSKVIDRLNPEKEAMNPMMQRFFTAGSIAPNWIRVNIGLTKDAITKSLPIPVRRNGQWGTTFEGRTGLGMQNAGDIARTTVFGGRLLLGAATVIGSALVSGKMPTLQQALNEAGFNPNNPVPNFQSGNNTDGKPVVTNVPTDALGLGLSLLTNPLHFGIARETPGLSAATQAYSNQDWTGNQLVDKSQPGWQAKLALKTGEALLPFSAQNFLNSKLTTGQKIEAAFGLRTHRDPNDPQYKAAIDYVNAAGAATNDPSLGSHDKDVVKGYLDKNRDADGNVLLKGPQRDLADAKGLFSDDAARNALQKQMQKLSNHDPIWDLSPQDLKTFFNYQSQIKDSGDQQVVKMNNPWLSDLEAKRSDYFDSLHLDPNHPGSLADPNDPPVKYPLSKDEGQLMAQAGQITDPTAKTQFYADNPQLVGIEQKYGQYVNAVRQGQGAQPLPMTAPPDAQTTADLATYNGLPQHDGPKGGNKTRAIFLQSHPNVTNYFTQSAYNSLLRNAAIADANNGNAGDKQQQLLKSIKDVGSMDIGTAANGSLALGSLGGGSSSSGASRFSYTKKSSGGSSKGVSVHIRMPKLRVQYKSKPHAFTVNTHTKAPYIKAAKTKVSASVPGTTGGPKIPIELKSSTKA